MESGFRRGVELPLGLPGAPLPSSTYFFRMITSVAGGDLILDPQDKVRGEKVYEYSELGSEMSVRRPEDPKGPGAISAAVKYGDE